MEQEIILEPLVIDWALVTTPFPIPGTPPPITPENPNPTEPTDPSECEPEWPSYGQKIPNPRALKMRRVTTP